MVKIVRAGDGVQGGLRVDKVAKILAEKAAEVQQQMTPRQYDEDADLSTDAPEKPQWERLPADTSIRVWWASAEEYYECKILDWRFTTGEDNAVSYLHRCQYPGGILEHDLSCTEFEVVELDEELDDFADSAHGQVEHTEEEGGEMSSGARSRMRKWLARQEEAEKDRTSTASETNEKKNKHDEKPEGSRGTMRRVHRAFKGNILLSPLKRVTGTRRVYNPPWILPS